MAHRDPSFDTLLDLHGQVLVIDEAGYWVKFVVHRVPETAEKPHGLDYSLTLHGPDGERLVGFDNAHPVGGHGEQSRITGTACEPFALTTTAMPAGWWPIFGPRWKH